MFIEGDPLSTWTYSYGLNECLVTGVAAPEELRAVCEN